MQRFDRNGPRICKKKAVKKRYAKGGSVRSGSICAAAFTAALTGCVSTQAETEKIRDMKYEVIEEEDIPQSLREMIKGGEKKPFRIYIFGSGIPLDIAQGYEVQPTTGYSVEVKELYETENGRLYKNDSDRSEKRGGKRKSRNIPLDSRAERRKM